MADIMMNLKTFQPEYGAGTNEPLLRLRCRAKGLTANACAHAIFFCKLLQATRQKENEGEDVPTSPEAPTCNQCLKIGIIGGGHMGKQLARTLLELGGFSEKCIQISTRRPETLPEFQKLGVDCFYNNKQLVSWADVVFLCCLPFHLPHICSEIQDTIQKHTIIYSVVTAIPLPRLKHLLSCNTILRPQYTFTDGGIIQMWEASRTVVETLQDPAVIQATCPCSPKGEIFVSVKWLAGVFYAALNSYTLQNLSYMRALGLLNEVCSFEKTVPSPVEDNSKPPLLVCENFINQAYAACLGPDDAFPWFDLTAVQLKESPFSQLLATDKYFHDHIASFYCKTLAVVPARKEDSAITISKKIPLSAVLLHPDKAFSFIINAPCANKAEDESTTESEDA